MKKFLILIFLLQLTACEENKTCSDIIKGKPDHLISSQDLNTVKSLFKLNNLSLDNFQVYRLQKDELGHHHVRCYQFVNDLHVLSNDVIFHFDPTGHYYFLSGEIIQAINISPTPHSDQSAVIELFLNRVENDDINNNLQEFKNGCFSCELGYWDLNAGISYTDVNFRLAWRVKPEGNDYPLAIINDSENQIIYYDNGIRY